MIASAYGLRGCAQCKCAAQSVAPWTTVAQHGMHAQFLTTFTTVLDMHTVCSTQGGMTCMVIPPWGLETHISMSMETPCPWSPWRQVHRPADHQALGMVSLHCQGCLPSHHSQGHAIFANVYTCLGSLFHIANARSACPDQTDSQKAAGRARLVVAKTEAQCCGAQHAEAFGGLGVRRSAAQAKQVLLCVICSTGGGNLWSC